MVRVYLLLDGQDNELGRVRARDVAGARAEGAAVLSGQDKARWTAGHRRVRVLRQRVTGRPRQRRDMELRSCRLSVPLSDSELAAVGAAAEAAGERRAAFVRRVLLQAIGVEVE